MLHHRNVWVGVVALGLAASEPAGLGAQTGAMTQRRVAISITVGFILEPAGTLRVWGMNPGSSSEAPEPADNRMGLGHNNPVKKFALYPVPGVKDVVAISATATNAYAVARRRPHPLVGRAQQRRAGEHDACRVRDEGAAATGDADADTRGRTVQRGRCFGEEPPRLGACA